MIDAKRFPLPGRLLLAAAVAWVLAAMPAGAAVFNPETFTLANGMEVVVVPNKRVPVVTHMVWYKVGAGEEEAGRTGIAHFLEHLMFKGTPSRPDGEFSKLVARNGGRENAFTAHDYTAYHQTVAKDRLPLVMELEADRMTNLIISQENVDTERQVVLEERRSRTDNDPSSILFEQASAAAYLNYPYGRPVIGWEHEIRALTLEQILAFHKRWYAPNNAILVVAGDITAAELKPLAEKYYGVIPRGVVPERFRPTEPPQRAAREVTMRDPRVRQPSWSRSFLAPSYVYGETQHAYALEVLAEILGGGSTSRIYSRVVVEQGIATGAGAWYSPDNLGPSRFGFYGSPQPETDMAAIEAALQAEIDRVVRDGVTDDEVVRAKERLVASAVFARDSLGGGARTLGAALASGQSVADGEAWPDRIAAVGREQIEAAARAVFRPETSVTSVLLRGGDKPTTRSPAGGTPTGGAPTTDKPAAGKPAGQ